MNKLIRSFVILVALLGLAATARASLTVQAGNNFEIMTASAFTTTTTNSYSDNFGLGPFESASFQCAWSTVTGTAPVYGLQLSNDGTNWYSVTAAVTTTTGGSGSDMWLVSPIPAKYARVKVTTASTTGNLNCVGVLQGAK